MKTDRIHHTSYLLSHEINLADLKQDKVEVFDLKAGFEILQVSVIVTEAGTGMLDLGIKGESDFFLNDIDINTKGTYKSKVEVTMKENTPLILDTQARDGVVTIRVHYFTPSTMYR